MPFICLTSTAPDGVVQVLDLAPNASQKSAVVDPPAQSQYVSAVQNDAPSLTTEADGSITMNGDCSGLRAYIIDNFELADGSGNAPSAVQAGAAADGLIAVVDAGTALNIAGVNAAGGFAGVLNGVGVGNSTGTVLELLAVLAGRGYTVADGVTLQTAAGAGAQDGGAFAPQYTQSGGIGGNKAAPVIARTKESRPIRATFSSGSLFASISEGALAGWVDATQTYHPAPAAGGEPAVGTDPVGTRSPYPYQGGSARNALTANQAMRIATVYDDDGTVLG